MRVAACAGPAASALAMISAIGTISSIERIASGGAYTSGNEFASCFHASRPARIPSGTPTTRPAIGEQRRLPRDRDA